MTGLEVAEFREDGLRQGIGEKESKLTLPKLVILSKLPIVVQFTLCWWLLACFFCSLAVKFVVWCSGSCFKSGAPLTLSPFGAGTLEHTNNAVVINRALRVGLKVKVMNCFGNVLTPYALVESKKI